MHIENYRKHVVHEIRNGQDVSENILLFNMLPCSCNYSIVRMNGWKMKAQKPTQKA